MATLKFKNLNKIYPNGVQAVYDFNLEVKKREFLVIVGPSGSGKSTVLRMIAGLEEITSGELYFNESLINNVAPMNRDIGMVFQNYALYPHMTVFENMAFALTLRKTDKNLIMERVHNTAQVLGLTDYLNRLPKELSGGERQRVALGRAIVKNANLYLMDEPLSNLDAKLRVKMRSEISRLHSKLDITTLYVTHDQLEAMTMASRIVVMKDGRIMQVGEPKEIYDYPDNLFVASFIGTPPMNFIRGRLIENQFICRDLVLNLPDSKLSKLEEYKNKEIILGIRPDDIYDEVKTTQKVMGKVNLVEFIGSESIIYMTIAESEFVAKVDVRTDLNIGDEMDFSFDLDKAHFFDIKTKKRIKV